MNSESMDKRVLEKDFISRYNTSKWFYVFLFIIALMARGFAASRATITNNEAKNLLFLSGSLNTYTSTYSPIHHLYFQVIDFLFGRNLLALRLLSVVSGSMVVFLPYLNRNHLGQISAPWLAFFLLLDPFLNANSVMAVGYSLSLLLAGLLFYFLIEGKTIKIIVLAIAVFLSGPGAIFLIIASTLFFGTLFFFNKRNYKNLLCLIKEKKFIPSIDKSKAGVILLVFISAIFLIMSDEEHFSLGFQPFFGNLAGPFEFGNYPIVYPFLLIGYLPLHLSTFLLFFGNNVKKMGRYLSYWISFLLFLLFIFLNPGHQYFDLVWVSIPLAVISAKHFGMQEKNFSKKRLLIMLVFCVGITSLLMNVESLIYSFQSGTYYSDILASIAFIIMLVSAGVIFIGYLFSYSFAWEIFRSSLIVVLVVIQISTFSRSLAVGKKPEQELIWNGFFQDREIIIPLFKDIKNIYLGTTGLATVELEETANPALLWYLANEKIRFASAPYLDPPEFVFAEPTGFLDRRHEFFRQEFIMESYPKWTWQPVRSFLSTDYWSWFFWRDGQLYKQYYSMFVRNDLFYTSNDGSERNR